MLTSVQHVDLLCQHSAGLDTQHLAIFFLSNSADFCIIGLWERFLKIWAMNIRSSSLSSNQRSFPTDHILARDRETSKLTMLMQPSNMQASVPGVAMQTMDCQRAILLYKHGSRKIQLDNTILSSEQGMKNQPKTLHWLDCLVAYLLFSCIIVKQTHYCNTTYLQVKLQNLILLFHTLII